MHALRPIPSAFAATLLVACAAQPPSEPAAPSSGTLAAPAQAAPGRTAPDQRAPAGPAPEDGERPPQERSSAPPGASLRFVAVPGTTPPLAIQATEVTVAQYRACMDAGACDAATVSPRGCNLRHAGPEPRDAHPVNCVDWHGADAFCRWSGARLCTEPEWLGACRGPGNLSFPYGQGFDLAACNVQSTDRAVEGRGMDTWPVGHGGSCEGGTPGVVDLAGNVAEWVDSCKGDYCKFRGAGFRSNEPVERFAGCKGVCSGNKKAFKSAIVGFRCCR